MEAERPVAAREAGADDLLVRPARPDDLPRIWEMVLALATYERLRHEVRGSPDHLAEHLFGERPLVECLVAESEGGLVGYALFYPTYSSFSTAPMMWLEDLFVEPRCRGKGAGRGLLVALARIVLDRGCARLGWAVLDWNRDALEFYERTGARPAGGGWLQYGLSTEALQALAGTHKGPER